MEAIQSVTLAEAQGIVSAAQEKAEEIGQPMNIAVVEVGGRLKAFGRMETAWTASIEIAIDKAFTAAALGMPTEDIGRHGAARTAPVRNQHHPRRPDRDLRRWDPLIRDDEVVGAVGVSGGTVDQDQEVAEAGVAAF